LFLAAGNAHHRANDGLAVVDEEAAGGVASVVALQDARHEKRLIALWQRCCGV
jgi:hypothetical protein